MAATSRPVQSQQQQQLDQSPVKRDTVTDRGDTKEETPSAKETTNGNDKTEDTTKGVGVSRCGPSGLTLEHYMFPFENVVFEGGGSKCLAYCGAVRVSGTFEPQYPCFDWAGRCRAVVPTCTQRQRLISHCLSYVVVSSSDEAKSRRYINIRKQTVNIKHLHNICTMSGQLLPRWAEAVQMLYKCSVFAGLHS